MLFELVAEELPPDQREDLHRHADGCPECSALVESYRIIIRLGRRLPPVPMPPGCLARLQAVAGRFGDRPSAT
jgi:hypothetical protein